MDFYYPHPYIVWESMLANKWDMLLSKISLSYDTET